MIAMYVFSEQNSTYSASVSVTKRYFKIDQHLAWHFVFYVECLSSLTPFICSQIITHFLNTMIFTNKEKKWNFKQL